MQFFNDLRSIKMMSDNMYHATGERLSPTGQGSFPESGRRLCAAQVTTHPPAAPHSERRLTTEELALALGMNAGSIRKRYSQTGSYFGLKPVKLRNGKLRWPADALMQLMSPAT